MSEQERIELYNRLGEALRQTTKNLLERKAKLGETVVIADANGQPLVVPAAEALKLYTRSNPSDVSAPAAPPCRVATRGDRQKVE